MTEKEEYYYRALQLEEYFTGFRHDSEAKDKELIQLKNQTFRKDEELVRLRQ